MNKMGKMIDKPNMESDMIEIVLNDNEINELINKLKELSENKSHIHFNIDSENEILIHHGDDEILK